MKLSEFGFLFKKGYNKIITPAWCLESNSFSNGSLIIGIDENNNEKRVCIYHLNGTRIAVAEGIKHISEIEGKMI